MKGRIYAIILLVAFVTGSFVCFFFALRDFDDAIHAIVAFAASLIVVPTVHELGHIVFAAASRMQVVRSKFFCFCVYRREGKWRFRFVSPLRAEETQAIPKDGEDMKKRTLAYTVGGLIFSAVLLAITLIPAILLSCFSVHAFSLWGMVPFAAYLLLLNSFPVQYASGKTDALIYREIKKESAEGKAFVAAMTVQGRLFAGDSYADVPEEYYETYGLREDDPLYAVLWEMKYRYFLEKNQREAAADALNRVVDAAEYLSEEALKTVQVETAYMFLLQKDGSELKNLMERDEAFLRSDDYRAKRLLATYAYACNEAERGRALVEQAKECLQKQPIAGVRKHELLLLSRLTDK